MEKSEEEKVPFKIRPAMEGDVPFIFSSWLKSYRASIGTKQVNNTVFFSEHHKIIENLLRTSSTFVICPAEDEAQICGYICAEQVDSIFVLHYVYVKQTFRGLGIAKLLLNKFDHDPEMAGICTHMTRVGETLSQRYGFLYNPYVATTEEYARKRRESLEARTGQAMEAASEAVKRDE
jgi:GNAT superfamily N-acetyltransferase